MTAAPGARAIRQRFQPGGLTSAVSVDLTARRHSDAFNRNAGPFNRNADAFDPSFRRKPESNLRE